MAAVKHSNFFSTTLATPPTGTTESAFTVTSATNLPTLAAGDWCYVVLKNASLTREVIKIDTISGVTLTPAAGGRGVDGSTAYASWVAGDVIELCLVNASLLDLLYGFKESFYNTAKTFKSVFANTNTAARIYTFQDRDGNVITDADIHAATSKATPVDADEFALIDSAASNVLKKLTWANLVVTLRSALTPSGVVWLWTGSVATIPSGFLLCDGTVGTPDLRNRFVVGAGSGYAVGAAGGSADAVVVTHSHTATSTDAGHTHDQLAYQSTGGGSNAASATAANSVNTPTGTGYASITTTVDAAGVSGTGANLPPYYALCYIMKS